MKPIQKILILCDVHDCLRHEGLNKLLLKQLYVTVFLLKKHYADQAYVLHINNRGIISFEHFWPQEHQLKAFLNPHIVQKPWAELNLLAYDLIITHPDYQQRLQQHVADHYGAEDLAPIYTFVELQYPIELHYQSAATLFGKAGYFAFENNSADQQQLSEFKQAFEAHIRRVTINQQEACIPALPQLMQQHNSRLKLANVTKFLILDDYKRPFFIGDSVHWLAKIKKLISLFPDHSECYLNIDNQEVYESVCKVFQQSLPPGIHITHTPWKDLSFRAYDTILCNNDILLKFYWFITAKDHSLPDQLLWYSFSVMDERNPSQTINPDFYTNVLKLHSPSSPAIAKIKKSISNQLSILPQEQLWASNWLADKGVTEGHQVIVLIHGASSADKVMYDLELFELIKKLSSLSKHLKLLLITEKELATYVWLNEIISQQECANVVIGDALSLRQVMRLFADRRVAAVIGPCTGLMHLADGVYNHLLQQHQISAAPLLLTYAGKQAAERNYHPNQWWKNSKLVHCAIHVRPQAATDKPVVSLQECPTDFDEFNRNSIPARGLTGAQLFNFILETFPAWVQQFSPPVEDQPAPTSPAQASALQKIPTYIISLKHRHDRRDHILQQFEGQEIFDCQLVNAIENENGRLGLWLTIKKIISDSMAQDLEYLLICEDDHQFTADYSTQKLVEGINQARSLNAHVLLGGICYCDQHVKQVEHNLIAVDHFACTQFTLIFRSFFEKIMSAEFLEDDCADHKIARLSDKKFVLYPFISVQKDFGYSDVSQGYYESKMDIHFKETARLIQNMIRF